MASIEFIDVSQWQGNINFGAVDRPAAIIKMSGGDAGLYYDSKAGPNYYGFKGAGKHVGGYHFAGGNDPTQEADFFVGAMAPTIENDVYVLDWELGITTHPNAAAWCQTFMQRVHDRIGVWPMIYMNLSTLYSYDWSWVLARCGLWIAAPSYSPDSDVPTRGHAYVAHQYGSPSNVPGVAGACDVDRFWGTLAQFDLYGWHSQTPPPPPPPQPVVTHDTETQTRAVPFEKTSVEDPTVPGGKTEITTVGVDGIETITYDVTKTDGVETARTVVSDIVTTAPVTEVTTVGTMPPPDPVPDPTPTPDPTPDPTPTPQPPVKTFTLLEALKALWNLFLKIFGKGK